MQASSVSRTPTATPGSERYRERRERVPRLAVDRLALDRARVVLRLAVDFRPVRLAGDLRVARLPEDLARVVLRFAADFLRPPVRVARLAVGRAGAGAL